MTQPSASRGRPDVGSKRSRALALAAALLLSAVAILLQNLPPVLEMFGGSGSHTQPSQTQPDQTQPSQTGPSQTGPSQPDQADPASTPAVIPPRPGVEMHVTMAKLYIKLDDFVAGDPTAMQTLDGFVAGPTDRLRSAVIAAELEGPGAGLERLDALLAEVPEDDPLHADAVDLATLIRDGPDALPDGAEDRLLAHHGFFAEVALTHTLPKNHPDRQALREGGLTLILIFSGFGLLVILAFLAGIVLLAVGVYMLVSGALRPRMPVPAPGGSVYLEVYALFVAAFLAVSLAMDGVRALAPAGALWPENLALAAQWVILLVPLWPLLRGVSRRDLAVDLGWARPQSVTKEILFGVLGYLAGLPLFAIGVLITMVLLILAELATGGPQGPPPTNPVFEIVSGASPLGAVLLFALAVVWAPLCEETVFRGALQRHARAGLPIPISALLVATVFGFLHGYGPLLVFPLIALGFNFSVLREWRGSIIAPVTAHALHNGTVITMIFITLRLLG